MKENLARRLALEEFLRSHGHDEVIHGQPKRVAMCPHCGAEETDFRAVRQPGGTYTVVCGHCASLLAA
jgi:hypothetical protein